MGTFQDTNTSCEGFTLVTERLSTALLSILSPDTLTCSNFGEAPNTLTSRVKQFHHSRRERAGWGGAWGEPREALDFTTSTGEHRKHRVVLPSTLGKVGLHRRSCFHSTQSLCPPASEKQRTGIRQKFPLGNRIWLQEIRKEPSIPRDTISPTKQYPSNKGSLLPASVMWVHTVTPGSSKRREKKIAMGQCSGKK